VPSRLLAGVGRTPWHVLCFLAQACDMAGAAVAEPCSSNTCSHLPSTGLLPYTCLSLPTAAIATFSMFTGYVPAPWQQAAAWNFAGAAWSAYLAGTWQHLPCHATCLLASPLRWKDGMWAGACS